MKDDRIQIKGNKDGVNITIDTEKFIGFDDMLEVLVSSLSINKGFYKNSILKITANFKHISNSDIDMRSNCISETFTFWQSLSSFY